MLEGAALADPEPVLARLVRGCIAMVFTASVPADQSSHRRADTASSSTWHWRCNASKPRTACYCVLMLAGAVQADPEPMLGMIRGCFGHWGSSRLENRGEREGFTDLRGNRAEGGRRDTTSRIRESKCCRQRHPAEYIPVCLAGYMYSDTEYMRYIRVHVFKGKTHHI